MHAFILYVCLLLFLTLLCGRKLVGLYNQLIRLELGVKKGWAQIETELKRRHDLIDNLVACVRGYATYERATFEAVTQARSATNRRDQLQAERQVNAACTWLFSISERYPDLKANGNFLALMAELSGTENRIAAMRHTFNDAVLNFNSVRQSFPAILVAGLLGFNKEAFFESADEARRRPAVDFSGGSRN